MATRKNFLFIIFIFFILCLFVIYVSYSYILKKQDELFYNLYLNTNDKIIDTTKNSIDDKKHTTLAIALSLSKNENLYKYLENEEYEKLDFNKIIDELKQYSKYKNVWIQVVNKNAIPVYKSWTKEKVDISFRKDLQSTLSNPKVSTSISMGIYNLSLKARTPIYGYKNEFFGVLEVISHLNSVIEDLKKDKIESIVLVNKDVNKVLKSPISNIFINDYYVPHENANSYFVEYLKNNDVDKYFNMKDFIVENGYLITNYNLFNEKNEKVASIINFYDLKNIDDSHISSIKTQNILMIMIVLIVLFFILILYLYTKYTNKIKSQEQKNRLILDSQSSIVIITNGENIIESNKKLIEFFNDCKNLEDFKTKYKCICKKFVNIEHENYLIDTKYNGRNWAEHALYNQNTDFKVAIYDANQNLKHFSLKVSQLKDDNLIIATFTDISQEILEAEKEKNQQRAIFQQAKLNAISNTLNNIAHQWRQPLSVISTLTSGMKLKKDLNILSDNEFKKSCDKIIFNTTKLSNTIENFTNFFTKDDINKVSVVEAINQIIEFLDSIFERNQIVCHFKHTNDVLLDCDSNSFSEVILNIFDNSISALIENKNINERYIIITLEGKTLSIIDSGNGVDETLISKVCEPYFTTKHQAFGIGLGLYVVEDFFIKTLNKKIELKNEDFVYEDKKLRGLRFTIEFD